MTENPTSAQRMIRVSSLPTLSLLALILSSLRHTHVTASTSSSYNNSDDAMRLLRDVIDSFDNRLRPVLNQSQPVKVHVTFSVLNLQNLDVVNQKMALNVWVNFSWFDEIRKWNPEDYGGNDVIHPRPTDIWRPKTVLINAADERDAFGDEEAPLSIYSTGESRWYAGGLYYFVCTMDLTRFPFDQQTCTAKIMAADLGKEIDITLDSEKISTRDYLENGEWSLKSTKVESSKFVELSGETLAFVEVTVTFERRAKYYVMNVLIPVMCLSFLSLTSFVVPKESGERTSYAMTVLLALSFFMVTVASQLPANSNSFPVLGIYIFTLQCLSWSTVIVIVCQQRLCGIVDDDRGSFPVEKSLTDQDRSNIPDYDHQRTVGYDDQDSNVVIKTPPQNGDALKTFMMKTSHGFDSSKTNTISISNYRFCQSNRVAPQIGQYPKKDEEKFDERSFGNFCKGSNKMDVSILAIMPSDRRSLLTDRLRNLVFRHDDAFFMTVFTTLWVLTSIAFMMKITAG